MKPFAFYRSVLLGVFLGIGLAGCAAPKINRIFVMEYEITPPEPAADSSPTAHADRQAVRHLLRSLADELELQEMKMFETGGTFFFYSREKARLFSLEAWQGSGRTVIQVTDFPTGDRPSDHLKRSREYLGETLTRQFGSRVRILKHWVSWPHEEKSQR